MSTDTPSAADQLLIDHAHRHGFTVTAKMLEIWRSRRLLPGNVPGGGLGRGKGSTSTPAPESFDLVLGLARHAGRGKRPTDVALLLFDEELPVPEQTVRAAFTAAVDTLTVPGDDDPDTDPDQRLDALADHIADAGLTLTLVPARARRIDEGIARLARTGGHTWPPPELSAFDENPGQSTATPKDAALAAAAAAINGTMSLEDIGDLLRAMNPTATANPIASLVETTRKDVPEFADAVLTDDNQLALGPVRDARDHLRDLAATAPLQDLARTWKTAAGVRQWALDLCGRVEEELAAGQLGEAALEWMNGRYAMAGLAVLSTLKERDRPPAQHALDALVLLYQLGEFHRVDRLIPGCQWHLLATEGLMPPPVREQLQDLISRDAPLAGAGVDVRTGLVASKARPRTGRGPGGPKERAMGEISIERQHLDHLLADSASTYGAPYQRAFAELAAAHRGRPVAEILPLLRRAADEALLGFTDADLREQAQAISTGEPYVLRVTVA